MRAGASHRQALGVYALLCFYRRLRIQTHANQLVYYIHIAREWGAYDSHWQFVRTSLASTRFYRNSGFGVHKWVNEWNHHWNAYYFRRYLAMLRCHNLRFVKPLCYTRKHESMKFRTIFFCFNFVFDFIDAAPVGWRQCGSKCSSMSSTVTQIPIRSSRVASFWSWSLQCRSRYRVVDDIAVAFGTKSTNDRQRHRIIRQSSCQSERPFVCDKCSFSHARDFTISRQSAAATIYNCQYWWSNDGGGDGIRHEHEYDVSILIETIRLFSYVYGYYWRDSPSLVLWASLPPAAAWLVHYFVFLFDMCLVSVRIKW